MSDIINVVQQTITNTVIIEELQTQYIQLDLKNQTINAGIGLVDTHNGTTTSVSHLTFSGTDFSNIFNLTAYNAAVAAALGHTEA